jgi:hypothetical protein
VSQSSFGKPVRQGRPGQAGGRACNTAGQWAVHRVNFSNVIDLFPEFDDRRPPKSFFVNSTHPPHSPHYTTIHSHLHDTMIRSTTLASRFASRVAPRNNGTVRLMSKEIRFGVEGRAAMLKGVDTLADAVQVRSCER